MSRRITYFLFPGVALVALLLLAAPRIFADDGPKNPPARQPEREDPAARDARLAAENVIERDMAAKQPEFIAKLRASGTDFDTLDRVNLLVTTLTQESLDAAVRTSSAVVRGSVVGQDFDEKRGVVVSRLAMAETLAGPGQGKELTLAQVGGPMLNGDQPVLVQQPFDTIVRKGAEYVLILAPCEGYRAGRRGLLGRAGEPV